MKEAEQKAKQLVPCYCGDEVCICAPVWEAVAAALREAQQDGYIKGWTAGNEHEDELDAEIAKLKKDNADLVEAIDGAIKDREYYDQKLKEAEKKIVLLNEARGMWK